MLIYHPSCAPHVKELNEAIGDAKLIAWCNNETFRRVKGFLPVATPYSIDEVTQTYMGDNIYLGDAGAYINFINSVLFHLLDDVKQLPIDELLSQHGDDIAQYSSADLPSIFSIKDILGQDETVHLRGLKQLRQGDTRTILVVCADQDRTSERTGRPLLAEMQGCVMTIYPRAFTHPTRLRDIRPDECHMDDYCRTLSAVIVHELSHYEDAHNAVDYKLKRKDYDGSLTHVSEDEFFGPVAKYKYCYGHGACVALARSRPDRTIDNADSLTYTAVSIALTRAYAEVSFPTPSGCPEPFDADVIDVTQWKGRWDCFRHINAPPITQHPQYDAEWDQPRPELPEDELFGSGPYPEEGNELDECIEGVEYPNGEPWRG